MSRLWGRVAGMFRSKSFIGADMTVKEKRWVVFRREEDPTSIPVEWICWLNGQRKRAPTPEEMAELDARRERVKLNVALLKKEEEEKKAREGESSHKSKAEGPELTSFVRHFPADSKGDKTDEASKEADQSRVKEHDEPEIVTAEPPEPKTTEPSGSGSSFRPGTWQPPS
ncbi:NADH dehydrogenase [ubiquinone] 1 alpha subcomplex assembly factor 2 isoform X5 [Brassica rapa]|uniref:NADH dehydrogenase [ubiquinone] 1 alpha subcomplex assembly factor 2 isoform X5 n=1 Tax=Brassica campestris TaxID=3711 RepID=UPI00142E13A7|nr:NADH dehydrogenase [ubiquinone] 1 alpha subcomplex assembly factor 2 isoform X5 [Brassica rapa]